MKILACANDNVVKSGQLDGTNALLWELAELICESEPAGKTAQGRI